MIKCDSLVAMWERCLRQTLRLGFHDLLCERDMGYDCSWRKEGKSGFRWYANELGRGNPLDTDIVRARFK